MITCPACHLRIRGDGHAHYVTQHPDLYQIGGILYLVKHGPEVAAFITRLGSELTEAIESARLLKTQDRA